MGVTASRSSIGQGFARSQRRSNFGPQREYGRERVRMGFIAWIVVGAIAGFLASRIMGSHEGLLMMIVLGIVGGLLGGFVATNLLKVGSVDGINIESIFIATLGAIAVVFLARFARGSRRLSRS
jgi:uncharacterized membrane protein YeaQ/YmgE (transglycosylase-associated protein family)